MLRAAIEDGVEARIGLEDVTVDRAGAIADNSTMIADAMSMARAHSTR